MKFEIEKGIPIPPKRNCDHTNPNGIRMVLVNMDVGESIVVSKTQLQTARIYAKTINIKIETRKIEDNKYRVWKV